LSRSRLIRKIVQAVYLIPDADTSGRGTAVRKKRAGAAAGGVGNCAAVRGSLSFRSLSFRGLDSRSLSFRSLGFRSREIFRQDK
jgi:hypothetical protein